MDGNYCLITISLTKKNSIYVHTLNHLNVSKFMSSGKRFTAVTSKGVIHPSPTKAETVKVRLV